MRFSPAFLEEVRARVPVSTVVGRKVRLKKEGREWRGLSPFTSEKTPSFFVNDHKGRWFDFSAGKNGNIFDFVMETEGLTFPEAVEKLAGEAGLSLPAVTREDSAREAQRTTTLEAMDLAASFFEGQLRGRGGEAARSYLSGRGLGEDLQREFRIGLALRDRFALRDHLAGKGVSRDTMIEGGLLVHGEEIEVPYDRFRDRVMFPICDRSGQVIAFGGRALDPAAPAKYLNSPETPLFHKGSGLFNHHRARRAAHDTGRVIVVEGYVDAIAMTAAGFPDVVAPLGTALTPDQCGLLWRLAEEPILCFDGDSAGRKAAWRAIDTAMPLIGEGRTLRFALLPDGLDPDDLFRTGGREAVEAVIAGARPLVEMVWTRELAAGPLDTPERRFVLERRLREVVKGIADASLRRHYEDDLLDRASQAFERAKQPGGARTGRWTPRSPGGGRSRGPARTTAPVVSEALTRSPLFGGRTGLSPREAGIFATLIEHPELLGTFAEEIAALPLVAPELDRLRHFLLRFAGDDPPDAAALRRSFDAAGHGPMADRLAHLARAEPAPGSTSALDAEASLRQALALHRRSVTLHSQMLAAKDDFAAHPDDRNARRLFDLRTQLSDLGQIVGTEGDPPGLPMRPGWG